MPIEPIDPEAWFRLQARIRKGEPLPQVASEWLIDVLEMLRRGDDPRDAVGTKRGQGRRREPHALAAMHYWALREKHGSESSARKDVAV